LHLKNVWHFFLWKMFCSFKCLLWRVDISTDPFIRWPLVPQRVFPSNRSEKKLNVKLKWISIFFTVWIFFKFMKIEINLNWNKFELKFCADWHTRPVWAAGETANESTGRPAMRPARLLHSGEFTRPLGLICIFKFLESDSKFCKNVVKFLNSSENV